MGEHHSTKPHGFFKQAVSDVGPYHYLIMFKKGENGNADPP